jgi:acetyl esterase
VLIDPPILAALAGLTPLAMDASTHTPAERREATEANIDHFMRTLPRDPRWDAVDIEELTVPGEQREIPVRIFRPAGSTRALPAALYFFGGAFWMRSYDSEDMLAACRRLAVEADVVVVEIDYALAPEHPYPAALHEGMTVLRWMAAEGVAHGIDPERIAVGGFSSGGGLAAGLTLLARDSGGPAVRLQILEVPAVDLGLSLVATPPPGSTDADIAGVVEFQTYYLPDGVPEGDPYVVPANTATVEGLPPTMILSAELDVLPPSANAYADRLRAAGVPCVAIVYGGQVHFSPALATVSPTARAWRATVSEAMRGLHRDPSNPL